MTSWLILLWLVLELRRKIIMPDYCDDGKGHIFVRPPVPTETPAILLRKE